jgi:hypothetical protein
MWITPGGRALGPLIGPVMAAPDDMAEIERQKRFQHRWSTDIVAVIGLLIGIFGGVVTLVFEYSSERTRTADTLNAIVKDGEAAMRVEIVARQAGDDRLEALVLSTNATVSQKLEATNLRMNESLVRLDAQLNKLDQQISDINKANTPMKR